jgi:cobyrinic acid a,c-diamide synthase
VVTALRLPRVLFAAPGSGHGKTMVTTGVMAALRSRGLVVSPHKVGPDYIDPSYHALACARPGRNLDPHLQGEHRVAPLLAHGALTPDPADVAVIEGVMGLFDGAVGTSGFASSAHVAELVQAPVVLVVDCAAMARSVGAVVHGFSRYSDRIRVTGVILNNVASPRHETEARDGVAETGVPVLGVIPRLPDVVVPSRHLGLVPVAERRPEAVAAVEALAVMATQYVDLDAVLEVARSAPDLPVEPWDAAAEMGSDVLARDRPRVGVAAGAAFSFGYAETAELLAAAGAEVVPFDPLHDDQLPKGLAGLMIGGGFPEMHAAELAANTVMRRSVAQLAADGGTIAAECAGLLYLGEELDGQPMCGVLPVTAAMGPRLTLGYRTAVALTDSVVSRTGERVTGHEFHRTVSTVRDGAAAWGWRDNAGRPTTEGLVRRRIHASYLHVHWAGHPQLAARFVSSAAEAGR